MEEWAKSLCMLSNRLYAQQQTLCSAAMIQCCFLHSMVKMLHLSACVTPAQVGFLLPMLCLLGAPTTQRFSQIGKCCTT